MIYTNKFLSDIPSPWATVNNSTSKSTVLTNLFMEPKKPVETAAAAAHRYSRSIYRSNSTLNVPGSMKPQQADFWTK